MKQDRITKHKDRSATVSVRFQNHRRALVGALILFLSCVAFPQSAPAQTCARPGNDGPGGTLGGVINTYHPGAASVSAGATSIPVGASNINGAATPITAGDLLLVIQMQDAAINSSNNSAYGANSGSGAGYTSLNNAGRYEYVQATNSIGLGGGTITILGAGAGNGLINSYTNANATAAQGQRRFQVVRVPQYSSATLGSSLTAAAWDGASGGILAFDVAGNLNLGGATVSVDGKGFRGGGGRQLLGGAGANTDYRTASTNGDGGAKGEGVAGTPRYLFDETTNAVVDNGVEGYPNGSYDRGAPGNAGGGGTDGNPVANDQNSGGGGGNGGAGGLGGNSWSSNLSVGGFGGASIPGAANLLVLGGGGGAGTTNNATGIPGGGVASSGATGGGIVIIRAGSTSSTATITASGSNANSTVANDSNGGGGAGGSILFFASSGSLIGLNVRVRGGNGGSNSGLGQSHGPGGGGGGGFIALSSGAGGIDVGAGVQGSTVSAGNNYGALGGTAGASLISIAANQIPGTSPSASCVPVLTVTKTTSTAAVTNGPGGTTATYTIAVSNAAGRGPATGTALSDILPAGFTYASTGAVTLGGGATRPSTTNPSAGAAAPSWSAFDIPGGGSVNLTFTVNIASSVASGTYQNPATATYLDPTRTVTTGTTSASYNPASSTGEDVTVTVPAPPSVGLVKSVNPSGTQPPDTDLSYTITFSNTGGSAAQNLIISDPIPANTDFKVGSATSSLGTTGLTVTTEYSNDNAATWTYTPASGGGGAPASYDRTVTHVRWRFTGNLSQVAPNNAGSVTLTVRIR